MNWWQRKSIDHVWFLFALLVVMFIVIFMNAIMARAEGCLTIDVPPSAVLGNHDGDTFEVFTFDMGAKVAIRVLGVNTPEMAKKKGESDQPGAREAKTFTRQWLANGPFRVSTCGKHTFERVVGLVEREGKTLAQDLIDAGLGKKAPGGL